MLAAILSRVCWTFGATRPKHLFRVGSYQQVQCQQITYQLEIGSQALLFEPGLAGFLRSCENCSYMSCRVACREFLSIGRLRITLLLLEIVIPNSPSSALRVLSRLCSLLYCSVEEASWANCTVVVWIFSLNDIYKNFAVIKYQRLYIFRKIFSSLMWLNWAFCVERSLLPKAKISSTTHVQLLQWLHGKQQQQGAISINIRIRVNLKMWSISR